MLFFISADTTILPLLWPDQKQPTLSARRAFLAGVGTLAFARETSGLGPWARFRERAPNQSWLATFWSGWEDVTAGVCGSSIRRAWLKSMVTLKLRRKSPPRMALCSNPEVSLIAPKSSIRARKLFWLGLAILHFRRNSSSTLSVTPAAPTTCTV